jgi:integrase
MKEIAVSKSKEKLRNPNHPEKGSRTFVSPIEDLKDIQSIKKILSDNPRDLLLFTMGINNGLRAGDLLQLKVKNVKYLKIGESFMIKEKKTGKYNSLVINKAVHKALKSYLEELNPNDEDFLFASRKGKKPLTVQSVNALMKRVAKEINLNNQKNYGAHTLRKTFGYIQRTKYGISWEILAERFNHSTPAVTRRYLGITKEEVSQILLNEI